MLQSGLQVREPVLPARSGCFPVSVEKFAISSQPQVERPLRGLSHGNAAASPGTPVKPRCSDVATMRETAY